MSYLELLTWRTLPLLLAAALCACAEPDSTSSHAPAANAIDPPVASTYVESPPPTATDLAGVAAGDLGAGSAGEAAARAAESGADTER